MQEKNAKKAANIISGEFEKLRTEIADARKENRETLIFSMDKIKELERRCLVDEVTVVIMVIAIVILIVGANL